ncbi:MAG TPA: DinB family protein [Candidatus Krumholzibacteria bacterium]
MTSETELVHCPICGGEAEMPVDTLTALAAAPEAIANAMRDAPAGARDGWSPGEVVTHLADTEVVTGWRIRQVLAIDEPEIQPYDQDKWAAALRYDERDANLSLEAFAAARRANLEILRLLSDEDWERVYVQPEYGRQTLRAKIRHISDHDLAHLRQIQGG